MNRKQIMNLLHKTQLSCDSAIATKGNSFWRLRTNTQSTSTQSNCIPTINLVTLTDASPNNNNNNERTDKLSQTKRNVMKFFQLNNNINK